MAQGDVDPLDFKNNNRTFWCLGLCCQVVPCQTQVALFILKQGVAQKYGIEQEDIVMQALKAACCSCCIHYQIQSEVMKREGLTFSCMGVSRQVAGATQEMEMER